MKKRLTWILLVVAAGIALLVFFPFRKVFVQRNKVPLSARYLNFQQINEQYRSAIFEVNLFCKAKLLSGASPNPIRIFQSVNEQLIVECDAQKNEKTGGHYNYYRLSEQGSVMDSLHLVYDQYWHEFIAEFIISIKGNRIYYNTWPLNGDTTKREMIRLNPDFKWSTERENAFIKAAQTKSKYYFFETFVENEIRYRQFLCYLDRKWQLLLQVMPEYTHVDDQESARRYRNDVFYTGNTDPYLPENVKFLHFYPQEKMEYAHFIGGGQGGFTVYNWRGKGFFSTKIANQNFNFFVPNLAVEKEKFDDFKTRFYTVLQADYAAVNFRPAFYISTKGFAFYSSHPSELYLIKQRSKLTRGK